MIHLIVQASKYLMIFLFLVYTFECFHVFKFEGEEEEQNTNCSRKSMKIWRF